MKAVPNNIFRTGIGWYYVHRSRENNLIDKNNNYHSKSSEKQEKIKMKGNG
jgi:hypothetical protein